jgi:hypothetical protein
MQSRLAANGMPKRLALAQVQNPAGKRIVGIVRFYPSLYPYKNFVGGIFGGIPRFQQIGAEVEYSAVVLAVDICKVRSG